MSVNKVILVGNVGKDPEIKYIDSDTPVAKFPLATSESYKAKNGEKVETTEWHNIVMWRGLAKVVENFVKKGSRLFLEGKITSRKYEKDGQTLYFTEIVVSNMVMLDSKSTSFQDDKTGANQFAQNQNTSGSVPPGSMANEPEMDEPGGDEDLPF
jgi:single-strand DNA-binding protein